MIKKIRLYAKSVCNLFKMVVAYFLSNFVKSKYKNMWLIAERGYDAHDNGLVLYRYLKNNYPHINVKYVIDRNNKDSMEIDDNDIIEYKSFKHYLAYVSSIVLISTHIYGFSPNIELSLFLDRKNVKIYRGKKIFLQHGIIKDNIVGLHYPNITLDVFCCGALKEFNFIKENFGFPNDVVQYTGLARYDNLVRNIDEENFILIMPTWRKWLNNSAIDEFKETEYFKKYHSLLKNMNGKQKIIFCLHPEFIKFRDTFLDLKNNNLEIASYDDYSIPFLIKNCKFLITDYSSVFFDVTYMNKNTIFYQFDRDRFQSEHYSKGYLDYNDFGFVCSTEEEILKNVRYCENNINNFNFEFLKRNYFTYEFGNCDRIVKLIFKKLGIEEERQ